MANVDPSKFQYPITNDLLEKVLTNGDTSYTLTSFKCHKMLTEGSGFMSDIYRLRLNWKCPDNNLPTLVPSSVVLKIRTNRGIMECETLKDCDEKTFAESFKHVHETECTFYVNFGSRVPLPVPKCYQAFVDDTDGNGYILMEDLAQCQEISPYEGFSLEHLNEIVDYLANLHSWSLNSNDWKSNFKHIYDYPSYHQCLYKLTNDTLDSLCKFYPTHFKRFDLRIIDKAFDSSFIEVPENWAVLTHGDMWIHNIIFDPTTGKVAGFIDWQFANIGNFVDDFVRIMVYSVRTDVRHRNEMQILQRYYDRLKIDISINLLPDFETLFKMYKTRFACESFKVVCDFNLLVEECLKRTGVDEQTKQSDLAELLYRGSSTLNDAEIILKTMN